MPELLDLEPELDLVDDPEFLDLWLDRVDVPEFLDPEFERVEVPEFLVVELGLVLVEGVLEFVFDLTELPLSFDCAGLTGPAFGFLGFVLFDVVAEGDVPKREGALVLVVKVVSDGFL